MTLRIDLGDELADFDESKSFGDPTRKPGYPAGQMLPSGGSITPLADLQASGFNTTPPDTTPPDGYPDLWFSGAADNPPPWTIVTDKSDDQDGTDLQRINPLSISVGPYPFVVKDGEPISMSDFTIPDGFEEIGRIDE